MKPSSQKKYILKCINGLYKQRFITLSKEANNKTILKNILYFLTGNNRIWAIA